MAVTLKDAKVIHGAIAGILIDAFDLDTDDTVAIKALREGKSFSVDTCVGILRGVIIQGEKISPRKHTAAWIHFRFDDVAKAKERLWHDHNSRLNPYSGKWNFHFGAGDNWHEFDSCVLTIKSINPRNFQFIEEYLP